MAHRTHEWFFPGGYDLPTESPGHRRNSPCLSPAPASSAASAKNSHERAMCFAGVAVMFAEERFYAPGKPSG